MKKSNFDDLLQRYLTHQVTEEERQKIEAWLEIQKTEDDANLELTTEGEEKLFQKITAQIDSKPALSDQKKKLLSPWMLRVAASVALVMALGIGFYWARTNFWNNSGTDKMVLNDGTLVWLKKESTLLYSEQPSTNTRRAELRGEGLFEVAKDANRPFVITCGDFTIRVLGTSFNLKTNADGIELKVLTGKVNVTSPQNNINIDLAPMQEIKYSNAVGLTEATLTPGEVASLAAYTEYNMQFTNQQLSEVLERLEDKFDVAIETDNKAINACHITADFTDHSLETSLKLLTEILHVNYMHVGENKYFIKGTGCQ